MCPVIVSVDHNDMHVARTLQNSWDLGRSLILKQTIFLYERINLMPWKHIFKAHRVMASTLHYDHHSLSYMQVFEIHQVHKLFVED